MRNFISTASLIIRLQNIQQVGTNLNESVAKMLQNASNHKSHKTYFFSGVKDIYIYTKSTGGTAVRPERGTGGKERMRMKGGRNGDGKEGGEDGRNDGMYEIDNLYSTLDVATIHVKHTKDNTKQDVIT